MGENDAAAHVSSPVLEKNMGTRVETFTSHHSYSAATSLLALRSSLLDLPCICLTTNTTHFTRHPPPALLHKLKLKLKSSHTHPTPPVPSRLLYRSDREYDEAIKCYKNALRMDPDNSTVLRDLAQLQVHMRDLQGYLESRQTMLEGRPNNRQNWVSFAVAHHLCGNYDVAAKVLNSYENTLEEGANDAEAYEQSEVLLYKAWILEEGGMLAASLEALEQAEDKGLVRDILGGLEARGRLFLGMQRYSEAEQVYRRLLRVNPENHRYHHGLRAAVQLVQVAPAVGAAAGEAPAAAFAQEVRY